MKDYFGLINDLLELYEKVYNEAVIAHDRQGDVDIDKFTKVVDYDRIVYEIQQAINGLKQLKVYYRFARLSKERWIEYLENKKEGEAFYIKTTQKYVVKEYEDIQGIAIRFNTDWREILKINHLKSTEIEGGLEINIPVIKEFNWSEINPDVFGSQDGEKALGVDLENPISPGYNGDLKIAGLP